MKESVVQVWWKASDSIRGKEFIETGLETPALRCVEFETTSLTPEQRERLLALNNDVVASRIVLNIHSSDVWHDQSMRWVTESLRLNAEPSLDLAIELAERIAETHKKATKQKTEAEMAYAEKVRADKALRDQIAAEREEQRRKNEEAKAEWIKEHGSAHLRRAFDASYDCQRQYVIERAAQEAPGYVVDFNNTAAWDSRTFPSETALNAAEDAGLLGLGTARVVWLTSGPSNHAPTRSDYYDDYDEWEPCEAVVIRYYLNKYDLVMPL